MAVSGVEAVLEFLRSNGFSEAELALKQDIVERDKDRDREDVSSFDFEMFLFPMVPPPRPVKISATENRRSEVSLLNNSSFDDSSSCEEFVSLGSSTSRTCSAKFVNPYGVQSDTQANSDASSDRLSQFGTARDYHEFEIRNESHWYEEKEYTYPMSPFFGESDSFNCPTEDKFVMSLETEKPTEEAFQTDYLDKPCLANMMSAEDLNRVALTDYDPGCLKPRVDLQSKANSFAYGCSVALCKCGGRAEDFYRHSLDHGPNSSGSDLDDFQLKFIEESKSSDYFKSSNIYCQATEKDVQLSRNDNQDDVDDEMPGEIHEPEAAGDDQEDVAADEFLTSYTHEEDYEVFDLRIIHRKNRTGFEENKDLPIILNAVIAGRYYVTEYLGSAAFSKVVQAQDLHTGMDVCLKIIKNDKDFFDQSLDEIKLLKLVNKHDPADERHILRLYDYFYHQEHLFIVCELLRANLYEFQKFNQESGGYTYFTLSRLQTITRQCLEALEYLHHLGIIHCDLKPENILIKSYRRSEIKIIDLGSSCFLTDNLCLYVQSRSYRAPEVILGLPYDQKIDIWSLGCILAELSSGEVLFPNEALVMILARMIGLLGPIDMEMLVKGQETHKYFTKEYDLYHINEETNQVEYIFPEESSLDHHLRVSDSGFIDFVHDLLEMNPERRPTASEALEHPWLSYPYD
ncbi:Protein kinase domain [Dillenia turbinata]|uniref:Protein kinase domain n=1 Tax=Dillenia turbinata TaxID=194707 RepID=A0AAN8VDF9_9MAGN